ncbi:hypothetical protein V1227_02980 [Lentzea sp. DG1S-22]|nr:hypothetical protein [Lentzea sp. DG1S-22]WVH81736.1 hypothetical protein V1227_02980 [Lentzea sp. DG1S-22]
MTDLASVVRGLTAVARRPVGVAVACGTFGGSGSQSCRTTPRSRMG